MFTKYEEKKEIKIPSFEKLSKSGSKKRTRTTNTHNSFQNQIATTLKSELGFTFKGVKEPKVDLFWSKKNLNGIIEVKTLIPETNEKEDGYFKKGTFYTSQKDFKKILSSRTNISFEKIKIIKGFYSESLTKELLRKLPKAGIVHIDVDLYSSTKEVLDFRPLN